MRLVQPVRLARASRTRASRRTASRIATWPPTTFDQVGLRASSRSAMNTRAPELRALIIIFGSAGPVISTRRSSRSARRRRDPPVAGPDVGGRRPGSPAARRRRSARGARHAAAQQGRPLVAEPALQVGDEGDRARASGRRAVPGDGRSPRARRPARRRSRADRPPDGRLDQAVRLVRRDEDLALVRAAERRRGRRASGGGSAASCVTSSIPGSALEHRGADHPDRVLDRLAVVVGERREQRADERRVAGVPVRRGVGAWRQDAVTRVAMIRSRTSGSVV